ncbi:hypothetical protein QYF61_018953 [Mycteria americana]|uniref:Uncharacterized protein n=1 Tax=Mycteria americana TaxID=33587 RepID=A0AAN7S8S0_MYCAM|nr:hypothetical protein QYF61_018953 [Mycteria americana]
MSNYIFWVPMREREFPLLHLRDRQKLNMSQQCALAAEKANSLLGCVKGSRASSLGEMIIPFHSALVKLRLEFYAQFCLPQYKKDINKLQGPRSWLGLEHLPFEEMLRELGLFSLEKEVALGGDVAAASPVPMGRLARRQGFGAWRDDERLDVRRNSFPMRTVRQWNRLSREVMQSLSLEIAKT